MNKTRIAGFCIVLASWLAGVSGAQGAVFVKGDYNADGICDLAMYDNASGMWTICNVPGDIIASNVDWGGAGLQPVSGDYDGDGIWDLAMYHAGSGRWYIRTVAGTLVLWDEFWGGPDMTPVPGDYNGDGIWDLAVYQASTGRWFARTVQGDILVAGDVWGGPGFEAVSGDYDGDGCSDTCVYSEATGTWRIFASAMGLIWEGVWGAPGMKPVSGDFDGDGVSDNAVRNTANGLWYIYSLAKSTIVAQNVACGIAGHAADAADFDGDMKDDPLTYDTADGIWMINFSRSQYAGGTATGSAVHTTDSATNLLGRCLALTYAPSTLSFNQAGMTAFVGDFNGDSVDELGAYQPDTGRWYIRESLHGTIADMELGGPGAEPVVGDYDGDGIADLAVFERASALWVIMMSSGNGIAGVLGNATSIPMPADYDGDGLTDPAVYQPETGYWQAFLSGTSTAADLFWGFTGVQPVAADFDGDSRADPAVFWPEEARWYILKSGGGTVLGQVFGWSGCVAIPADYDEDGLADLAVYWPAGGQWIIHSSAYDFTRIGFWNPAPGITDPAHCQAVSARFGAGSDRRVCVLDQVTGQMLTEPSEPQFTTALGEALLPVQDIKDLLIGSVYGLRHTTGSGPSRVTAGAVVKAVLGIAESIIEDYEQDQRDAKIELMNQKLDTISTNLAEVMEQQKNLLVQLSLTRKQLESAIWQSVMSDAIKKIHNTHKKLLNFNLTSYTTLSKAARAIKVAEFLDYYRDSYILRSLDDIHTHMVGQNFAIPSSLDLWNSQLIDKVKAGQDLALCYRSLEQYFTEMLTYQVEGLQVYGHQVLYTNGVPGQAVFENYVDQTFAPNIAEQTTHFLVCVDALAAASLSLGTEIAAVPPPTELPESVRAMYKAADFLAASVSTGANWGLKVRVIGEPENVQTYVNSNQYACFEAADASMVLQPIAVGGVRLVGNLKNDRYLAWTWWSDGATTGYNKFKTETQVAVAQGSLSGLAAGDYVVCAPWGTNLKGRQMSVTVQYYDAAMNTVQAGTSNAHLFGSAVMFVRSQPVLREGVKQQIDSYMMDSGYYAFSKQLETARGNASIEVKTESINRTPWYFLSPWSADKASLILAVANGDAADTKLTFAVDAHFSLYISSLDLWDTMGPQGYGSVGTGYARLGLVCGSSSYWSENRSAILYKETKESANLEYTVPAGGSANLEILAYQKSLWPCFKQYSAGVWNKTLLKLKTLQVY
ncbi:MAG: VCBS repeat-containing protein [Verrucomicrobia bacterium]|nr:VCBS repeat-containing protein [Verrucomicrobiota bacterium]MBU1856573.1 VCBS repeat-containing protein [Verrucomicrobiota bacterium]